MENEIWKPLVIENDVKIQVSNKGRVKWDRYKVGTQWIKDFIKEPSLSKGYLHFRFYAGGKHKNLLVHRAVAEAFIPNPKGYKSITHIDGNRLNNSVENLKWSPNRSPRKRRSTAKLDDLKVRRIRERLEKGEKAAEIAAEFDISPSYVSRIKKGNRWNSDHTKKMPVNG